MKINWSRIFLKRRFEINGLLAAALAVSLLAPAPALSFEFQSGDVVGSLDSTLSYGLTWRAKDQDPDLIGLANGGNAFSVNGDDGNLNYDKGISSNVVKLTSELGLDYRNFGLFVRGTAFYDYENEVGDRERTELTDEALELVGSDVKLLDAYIIGDFDLGNVPLQIRVGDQVVSWGESTFIQNSINAINPVNVSAIRLPGAELKEALVPEGMVWASAGLTDNTTIEAFYLYDWEETVIDPPGSYWSTNDFAGEGGEKILLGFGAGPDFGNAAALDTFLAVPHGQNREADDNGQYGVAFRAFVPGLNNTEFGFYYMNYHSRVPLISARTGTVAGATAAGNIGGGLGVTVANDAIANGVASAVALGVGSGFMTQTEAGLIAQTAIAEGIVGANTAAAITNAATDAFARTARYLLEYPEDIQLFGVSFNTQVESTGMALQGEVSYRQDMPLQIDDIELLFAALGPINPGLAANNQVGSFGLNTDIQGFILRDVTQAQMTATQLFGPTFGASQFVLLGEVGVTHVLDMPDKDTLRLDAPGTYISGNAALAGAHGGIFEPGKAFADATSWGYRLVGKLDFNNAIGAVTLSPRLAWQHDVDGNTPGPGGNFLEGRKAVTVGLGANYLNTWTADLSYTDFFGAGRYNLINDRDFVAMNIKYSF
jgi:hypothetical protein